MSFAKLLVISVAQLLGYPTYRPKEWDNHARMAWMEPIVIRDGYHDYVLMSAEEYKRLAEETVLWSDGDFGSEYITQAEHDRRRGPDAARRPSRPFVSY